MERRRELDGLLKEAFETSGFIGVRIVRAEQGMYKITMSKIVEYTIFAFIRTIGKSGWAEKPNIRRVQIAGFDLNRLTATTNTITCCIIGVERIYDRDIFVVWNVYNYGNHEKNRSCYVQTINISKAFQLGYFTTTDAKQKIWLSDTFNLDKLFQEYINFNKIL